MNKDTPWYLLPPTEEELRWCGSGQWNGVPDHLRPRFLESEIEVRGRLAREEMQDTAEAFPQWITSDTILEREIAPKLGAYIYQNQYDKSSINIAFLPRDIDGFVPEEDRLEFYRRHCRFSAWAFDALELKEYLEGMIGKPSDQDTMATMKGEVNRRIKEYSSNNFPGFKEKFLEFMGISPVAHIIKQSIDYTVMREWLKTPEAKPNNKLILAAWPPCEACRASLTMTAPEYKATDLEFHPAHDPPVIVASGDDEVSMEVAYCPRCGRPLTEEAAEALQQRIATITK